MAIAIIITPASDGWTLHASQLGLEQYFNSGGRAESAGRALAGRLALSGHAVELEIRLRDGALAGRISFPPTYSAAAIQPQIPQVSAGADNPRPASNYRSAQILSIAEADGPFISY